MSLQLCDEHFAYQVAVRFMCIVFALIATSVCRAHGGFVHGSLAQYDVTADVQRLHSFMSSALSREVMPRAARFEYLPQHNSEIGTNGQIMKLPKSEQITVILAGGYLPEKWYEDHLPNWSPDKRTAIRHFYKFDDLFDVTPEEVLAHVQKHGWYPRRVASMHEPLPDGDSDEPAPYYALLPEKDGILPLAIESYSWPERPRWSLYEFKSERERSLHIISDMFMHERNFWG